MATALTFSDSRLQLGSKARVDVLATVQRLETATQVFCGKSTCFFSEEIGTICPSMISLHLTSSKNCKKEKQSEAYIQSH